MPVQPEYDSEVPADDISGRLKQGLNLGEALQKSLEDLDGFFTFVVGTKNGFGVLRDPIACKPAVMAETDQYVAFGSEYRALAGLPGIDAARVWEPEPATVYFWER
jgi:glutamate synthase domain-containing protein 1